MIPKNKDRIAWDDDREAVRRIKIKSATEDVPIADVGRKLFAAWLADDPRVKEILAGTSPTTMIIDTSQAEYEVAPKKRKTAR